eukprot:5763269-Karenia_brevis.AAC.1
MSFVLGNGSVPVLSSMSWASCTAMQDTFLHGVGDLHKGHVMADMSHQQQSMANGQHRCP